MKLQEKNGQYIITLPKTFVKLMGWLKGDELHIMPDQYNKDGIIRKVR